MTVVRASMRPDWLGRCDICGAYVDTADFDLHDAFHAQIDVRLGIQREARQEDEKPWTMGM